MSKATNAANATAAARNIKVRLHGQSCNCVNVQCCIAPRNKPRPKPRPARRSAGVRVPGLRDARWDAIEPPAGRALQRSLQQDDKPADAARSGSLWLTAPSPKVALLRIGKISIA